MTILWIMLAFVFVLSFFARYFAVPSLESNTILPIKPNKLLMFGTMICFILVSGLRSNIGDTFFYKHIYEMNDFTWEYVTSQKDIGFGILQMILKMYSEDPQIMIFTTALITNVLIISVLYKYARMFELSVYVYITGGMFLVSMNGIRQSLAAAIIFAATKYLFERNTKAFILVVLLASTFHQSALVLIPIYFMAGFKAWTKSTALLLLCSVVIVIGFDQFSSILFSAIEDSQYGVYASNNEGGANIIRVIVYAAPLVLAFFGREKLREIFPKSDYIVNMTIIGLMFMVISTQNWIFARFSIYFNFYQLILISWVVKLFREQDQKFIYFILIICYLFYYYYENVISLNIFYKSDFFGG